MQFMGMQPDTDSPEPSHNSGAPDVPAAASQAGGPPRRLGGVMAVERGLAILDAFLDAGPSRGLSELARATRLPKPTVLRCLVSMERAGYVVRLTDGRYQLGGRLLQLGDGYRANFRLEDHVLPALRHLAELTGESASLQIREQDHRLTLFRVESRQSVRDVQSYAGRVPLDGTAASRVLALADWAEEVARGHARVHVTAGQRNPQIASMAAPVYGVGGRLVGSLTISGPIGRMAEADLPAMAWRVAEAAWGLSAALGAPARGAFRPPELIR